MDALAAYREQWEARYAKARAAREAAPKHRNLKYETPRDFGNPVSPRVAEGRAKYETRARELAEQGKTAQEIADAVGMSAPAIWAWAARRGITLTPAPRAYHDNFANKRTGRSFDYAEAARMYAAGIKIHLIARHFGVSPGSIRTARIAMGVPDRKSAYTRKPKAEFVNGEGWQ